MTIVTRRRLCPLNLKIEVQCYADTESFTRHLYKHAFDPLEGEVWKRILPLDSRHWKRLTRKKYLQSCGTALEQAEKMVQETLQACYDDYWELLNQEMDFADRAPLFTRLQEVYERPRTQSKKTRETYFLMSHHGLLIVIRNNVLRTAFFSMPRGKSTSFYDLFWSGMQKMLEDVQRVRSGKYWYHPETGIRIHGIEAEQVRPENFSNVLNPWPVTKSTYKGVKKEKRAAIEEIARQYFYGE